MTKGNKSTDGLRYQQRAKKRKTNFILNGLIAVVLILILLVSISIFSNDDEKKDVTADRITEEKGSSKKDNTESDLTSDEEIEQEENVAEEELTEESKPVITNGGEANVKRTIIDPSWKPIGTTQTGEHIAVYEDTSVDWQEMLDAFAYATDLNKEEYILWRLDNNGPNQSVGTVSTKDKLTTYRVYIKWVDNEGWVPTRVEELYENDKAQ